MIKYLANADKSYAAAYAEIYNRATQLFAEDERASIEKEALFLLLAQDESFIEIQEDQSLRAFLCFHRYGTCCELTALYVDGKQQRKGVGERLLHALEERLPDGSLLFAKVLKNAPWSLRFYEKNGFREVDTKRRQQAEAIGMTQKPWSMLLYKQIEQAKEQETATDL